MALELQQAGPAAAIRRTPRRELKMKKIMLIVSALTLVAGVAMAQAKSTAHKTATHQAPKMKTHDVSAEFVSFDAATKKITVKDDKGQTQTMALDSMAASEAKALQPGAKVTLTCRDNAQGEHEAITKIKPRK
jgi:hypothetical protein